MKTKKSRDKQRQIVYDWENKYISSIDYEYFDLSKSQSLVNDIMSGYGIERELLVTNSRTNRRCVYIGTKFEIRLAEWGKCRPTIIHEVSHALTRFYYGYTVQSHGKEFVGFLISLLGKYSRIPISELMRTADLMGVEYIHPNKIRKFSKNFRPNSKLKNDYTIISLTKKVPDNAYVVKEERKRGGFKPVFYYE